MIDFTPTTEQVRDAYVRAMRNAFIASAGEHREEFDRWLETIIWNRHDLAITAITGAYREFTDTRDTYELARAIGQILNGPDGDMLPEDQRVVVRHPDDEVTNG